LVALLRPLVMRSSAESIFVVTSTTRLVASAAGRDDNSVQDLPSLPQVSCVAMGTSERYTTCLDSDWATFREHLHDASDLVVRLHDGLDRARMAPSKSWMQIASLFNEPLPDTPQPMAAILREVEENVFANSALYLTPRFFGYINGCGNQAAIVGDLLAAAINQLCAKWHFSPAASEVERRVIRWIA
jgi:pyridoxal-dependent decarboxylase-like protein